MIDLAHIHVISGSGGDGHVSFRHEKFVSHGGPDGGDGGDGGDVIILGDEGLTTLAHFRHKLVYKAEPGHPGGRGHRSGGNGKKLVLKVPVGTVLTDANTGETWDIDSHGAQAVVARAGTGGRGNARFANSVRQAPGFAERGMPGEERDLRLELKLLADVGLVGLPNAGKSTLLRAVSHAQPDVADFPFTTLEPVLGVVDMGYDSFVMADLPGLIEGAHVGVGLGHQFLRHVERTRVLVHLLDAGAEDPLADYETVRRELALYDTRLAAKPEIVALNKTDLPDARERAEELVDSFPGRQVFIISGATSAGVRELTQALMRVLQETAPKPEATAIEQLPVLRPRARDRIEVEQEDGVFVVSGARAEEAALKLGASGEEALDELQDRLRKMGLEKVLRRAGARPGAKVRVRDIELEWTG
ncbi:MAG TPA: GTPase ObgE [Dehalococcoidia bacterium]|nr:GTPase ObgE [Dehalococcoidia bacterium]